MASIALQVGQPNVRDRCTAAQKVLQVLHILALRPCHRSQVELTLGRCMPRLRHQLHSLHSISYHGVLQQGPSHSS